MAIRKRASKRLKISTGNDVESGAKASYIRKLRRQQVNLTSSLRSEEETRLEEQLFGLDHSGRAFEESDVHHIDGGGWLDGLRSDKLKQKGLGEHFSLAEDSGLEDGLNAVEDDQLFVVDEPGTSSLPSPPKPVRSDETASEDEESEDSIEDIENEEPSTSAAGFKRNTDRKGKSTGPLWHDPADANLTVSLQGTNRLRKLRQSASENMVDGFDYEKRLRRQFQKIHPIPAWAAKAHAQKLNGVASDHSDEEASAGNKSRQSSTSAKLRHVLQSSSAGIRQSRGPESALPSNELDVTRLRDANQVDKSKSPITSVHFHPTVQVLFTASEDRRLKLFQIDGTHNPLVQSVHIPDLPITNASFHPSGLSILLMGQRPFFYSYDLQAGRIIRSPRGLWTGELGGDDAQASNNFGGSLENFKFSPDGRFVAIAGRRGYVHLLDWGTAGSGMISGGNGGQLIGQIKMNTGIRGLAWIKGGTELVTVGDDAAVYVWDVGTRKCIHRWKDDGGFGPSFVEVDRNDKYVAVGSRSGIVNVYDSHQAFSSPAASEAHKPLKSIMNLTTSISRLTFNHSSEILALVSKAKKDSFKVVHLPSLTVFSNWPTSGTPLGHVSGVTFSKGSEYVAIGNHKGKVLLYSIGHYAKV